MEVAQSINRSNEPRRRTYQNLRYPDVENRVLAHFQILAGDLTLAYTDFRG